MAHGVTRGGGGEVVVLRSEAAYYCDDLYDFVWFGRIRCIHIYDHASGTQVHI